MARRRAAKEDVVRAALAKQGRGESLTARERDEVERWKDQREEETVRRWLAAIPAGLFAELSGGKQTKQIKDQAQRHKLPMGGATVDMFAFVPAVFDLLARNKYKLTSVDDDDPLLQGAASPALERYREERTKLVRLERLEKEGRLLDRDMIHELFGRMAASCRKLGEQLNRQCGEEALTIFNEGLESIAREAETVCKTEAEDPTVLPGGKRA